MFGVLIVESAVKPGRSPQPISSVKIRTIFGGAANAVDWRVVAASKIAAIVMMENAETIRLAVGMQFHLAADVFTGDFMGFLPTRTERAVSNVSKNVF